MSMSHKKHFSREGRQGFLPLATSNDHEMANPNDITIDIPMTELTSRGKTGSRKPTLSPSFKSSTDFPDPTAKKQGRLHRGLGGRRKKIGHRGREMKDGEDGTLTAVGKIYYKIIHFSVLTRYFVYVAPLCVAFAVPIVVGATTARTAAIGGVPMRWFFTWVEVVWVSLWVSKLVSRFLPHLFQFVIGVVSPGTRKYALVITALEIPLSLVGWALTSLTTFVPIMTLNPHQRAKGNTGLTDWERIIKNILFAALVSTLIFLTEKFLIQLISIGYHRKQLDHKIKQSKRSVYLICLLYDASRALFPEYCPEFLEEDYLINDTLDIGGLASRGLGSRDGDRKHSRSGSITPMRFIQNVQRVGEKVTSLFGNVAQEITGKQVFDHASAHSIVVEALERKGSREALARRLWMSLVMEGKEALYHEDIRDVLGPEHDAEAEEAFSCLDVDGNGDISLDEMILRIGEFGRERYSIANSMHDVDQAINVLDNLLCTVVLLAVVLVFVAFLNTNFATTLATTGTALLSLSFVFATTAQELLGSCIFLFVKHPFDVGDRVDIIANGVEVQLVVEKISLLYTLFRRVKDHKKTQVANIILNTSWIDNVSRSNAMREQILLYINFDTTLEDIELLKKEMQAFVLDKDNAREFQSEIEVEIFGVQDMSKLELKVEIRHKSNWANEAVRAARRNKFMCALVIALRKVPIFGPGGGGAAAGDPANPTYSVAISDELAAANKKAFADEKDKKRLLLATPTGMAPTTPKSSATVGKASSVDYHGKGNEAAKDAAIVDNMNPQKAAIDAINDYDEAQLARIQNRRDSDLEQVREGLLRRQSTTGRRRASQQNALAPITAHQSNLPSIIATPPTESPPQIQIPRPGMTVGYHEDTRYNQTQSGSKYRPSQTAMQPEMFGTASEAGQYFRFPESRPTTSEEQSEEDGQNLQFGGGNQHPPRKAVPGMPEMKGFLGHNQR